MYQSAIRTKFAVCLINLHPRTTKQRIARKLLANNETQILHHRHYLAADGALTRLSLPQCFMYRSRKRLLHCNECEIVTQIENYCASNDESAKPTCQYPIDASSKDTQSQARWACSQRPHPNPNSKALRASRDLNFTEVKTTLFQPNCATTTLNAPDRVEIPF